MAAARAHLPGILRVWRVRPAGTVVTDASARASLACTGLPRLLAPSLQATGVPALWPNLETPGSSLPALSSSLCKTRARIFVPPTSFIRTT